ncbi:MAG: MFS transporter [Clostridia bacterium]|nr:MFS transporter [Clostridia bacterium]
MMMLLLAVIYAAFISLGLPDSVLGSAWPVMYGPMGVPFSWAGIVSTLISVGTVISSLFSDRLTLKLGPGRVTAISVALTAAALLGFSCSTQFWMLCVIAIPYGLGAGSIDAALNNYVALHYSSRHMSWLHCMWGVGASVGPVIMGWVLTGGGQWPTGYRIIAAMQAVLSAIILLSLPMWRKRPGTEAAAEGGAPAKAIPLTQLIRMPGAREVILTFFCYCALESTAGLWASTYLVLYHGVAEDVAATCASLFYIGITLGRAINGFLTAKFSDTQLVRASLVLMGAGVLVLLLPLGQWAAMAGMIFFGLGCAPVYPCIIHATPARFGAQKSQAFIGVQMAAAYLGTTTMPPVFGLLGRGIGMWLFPVFLAVGLGVMAVMHERLVRTTEG